MITSEYTPTVLSGTGTLTTFGIGFNFLENESNVKVSVRTAAGTVTVKTNPADYTVSGSNVEFGTAPAADETVVIELDVDYTQTVDLKENNRLPAEVTEGALDKLTLMSQQAGEKASGALTFSPGTAPADTTVQASTVAATRASKFVRVDETGEGMELIALSPTAGLTDIVNDTTPQLGGDLDLNSSDITGTGNVNITGNIDLTGTVDGRDVAADGTKLDGIEAAADVTDEANVTAALDGATLTAATVALSDKVLIQDADDSDNLKTATAQSIVDLAASDLVATQADMETATSTSTYVSPGRAQYHPSAAKAWVVFNGTGTLAVLESYNVTSVTDNGVGLYTINFDTAFSTANFAAVVSGDMDSAFNRSIDLTTVRTAGSVQVSIEYKPDAFGVARTDSAYVCLVAYGDQ